MRETTTIPPEFACTNAECPIGCPPEHAYDPRVTFLTGNEAIRCGTFAELGGTEGVTLLCDHAPFERIIAHKDARIERLTVALREIAGAYTRCPICCRVPPTDALGNTLHEETCIMSDIALSDDHAANVEEDRRS